MFQADVCKGVEIAIDFMMVPVLPLSFLGCLTLNARRNYPRAAIIKKGFTK
jgi:hypothetical protein